MVASKIMRSRRKAEVLFPPEDRGPSGDQEMKKSWHASHPPLPGPPSSWAWTQGVTTPVAHSQTLSCSENNKH